MQTVLALIQSFCRLRALEVPSLLVGATNAAELQYLEIYNRVGRNVAAYKTWEKMTRRATHVQLAAEDQGLLSTICGENIDHVVVETLWNDTLQLPISGPLSDQAYQQRKAQLPSGPMQEYRIQGGKLLIIGDTTAGHSLTLIYKSKNWLQTGAATGVYIDAVAADTNVSIFSDHVMSLGFEAFWRKEKELPFQTQLAEFTSALLTEAGNDNVPQVIHMHRSGSPIIRPGIIIPSGNWTV